MDQSVKLTFVEKGMKLEAVDRQYPTLICVATIADIQPSRVGRGGPLLIHFDGWPKSYDYWAEVDSPDLHPVGYTQVFQLCDGAQTLQKPKNYGREFVWSQYFRETNSKPVPLHIFTEAQLNRNSAAETTDSELAPPYVDAELPSYDTLPPSPPLTPPSPMSAATSRLPPPSYDVLHPTPEAAAASELLNSKLSLIKPGQKLEALDRLYPEIIAVATIFSVNIAPGPTGQRGAVLIHFDGWGDRFDYWAEADSNDLHPMGYMEKHGRKRQGNKDLQAPKGYIGKFSWSTYLQETQAEAVPAEFFTEAQSNKVDDESDDSETEEASAPPPSVSSSGSPLINTEISQNSKLSMLKKGMRLEALDRQYPDLICVATIKKVKPQRAGTGGTILIHFDGWGRNYDYWADADSSDLHPVGYMEKYGHKRRGKKSLQAPYGYGRPFSWSTYLEEEHVQVVPAEFFTETQANVVDDVDSDVSDDETESASATPLPVFPPGSQNSKLSMLKKGMRLEAVDRQYPELVCVATIMRIKPERVGRGGPILIHFDGWGNEYDYWAKADSNDLHPMGYMKKYGHQRSGTRQLQAPLHYGRNFNWATYLQEENAEAVPADFFTQAQTSSTNEYEPPTEDSDEDFLASAAVLPPSLDAETVMQKLSLVRVGMRLEALDRQFPKLICVATVAKIAPHQAGRGGPLLIHFDGWSKKYDYWAEVDSEDIHPVGFMKNYGQLWAGTKTLHPPRDHYGEPFDWSKYLREQRAEVVPAEFFTESQSSIGGEERVTQPTAPPKPSPLLADTETQKLSVLSVGMKLEAVDRHYPSLVCVATVAEIQPERANQGGPLRIRIDGWGSENDYWAETDSPHLHPIGFIEEFGHLLILGNEHLQPPHGYPMGKFDWQTYLRKESAEAVPLEFFTMEQKQGTEPLAPTAPPPPPYYLQDPLEGNMAESIKAALPDDTPK